MQTRVQQFATEAHRGRGREKGQLFHHDRLLSWWVLSSELRMFGSEHEFLRMKGAGVHVNNGVPSPEV